MSHAPRVTVITTVLNANAELEPLLTGLAEQDRPPDEVVVVDGGSTDGTQERLREWAKVVDFPVRVELAPGANISTGRNMAIRAASHDWIAVTDAGCRPSRGWLRALARPPAVGLISGVYEVVGESPLERALAVALYPDVHELDASDPLTTLSTPVFGRTFRATEATGRSMAFSRDAWRAAGGFPEDVKAAEDTQFARAIAGAGFPVRLEPEALVQWRPRPTWRANAKMYRGYARGDAELGYYRRHALRLAAWLSFVAMIAVRRRSTLTLAAAWQIAYCAVPFRRARYRGVALREWWRIPAVTALKDWSMIYGAIEGIAVRRRAPR